MTRAGVCTTHCEITTTGAWTLGCRGVLRRELQIHLASLGDGLEPRRLLAMLSR